MHKQPTKRERLEQAYVGLQKAMFELGIYEGGSESVTLLSGRPERYASILLAELRRVPNADVELSEICILTSRSARIILNGAFNFLGMHNLRISG